MFCPTANAGGAYLCGICNTIRFPCCGAISCWFEAVHLVTTTDGTHIMEDHAGIDELGAKLVL
eukprot:5417-Pleurochrysis_carterae.AAC.1